MKTPSPTTATSGSDHRVAFQGDAAAKARYVRAMFGRIAGGYDRMNDLMTAGRHRAWKRLAAQLADPSSDLPALDLCCGTGDQAFELARLRRGPVLAIDFAAPMLRVAQERAQRRGMAGAVSFQEADALCLPFPDACFSAVTTSFSLRNVAGIAEFIAEMRRVVVPGGRVVTLDLLGAPRGLLAPFGRFYLSRVVPLIGRFVAGNSDAYTYLPESTGYVPSAQEIAALMEQAGLARVSYRSLALGSVAIHVGVRPL